MLTMNALILIGAMIVVSMSVSFQARTQNSGRSGMGVGVRAVGCR